MVILIYHFGKNLLHQIFMQYKGSIGSQNILSKHVKYFIVKIFLDSLAYIVKLNLRNINNNAVQGH